MNTDQHTPHSRLFLSVFICAYLWFIPPVLAEKHTFTFDASQENPKANQVNVAGDFNGWSKVATPMADAGNGQFKVSLDIPEGVHFYKFVVNGDKWVKDPNGDKDLEIDDTYGGKNSAVLIGPDARKLPAPIADQINEQGIGYDPADSSDCNVATEHLLRLQLRTQADDVPNVIVLYEATPGVWKKHAMWKTSTKLGFDHFGTMLSVDRSPMPYL